MVRLINLLPLTLFLVGCGSVEDQIVDLSGSVFIIFLALIGLKRMTPWFAKTEMFERMTTRIRQSLPSITFGLYALGALLVLAGYGLGGIHRVLIFMGFAVAIVGIYCGKLANAELKEEGRYPLEVVTLGIGVTCVLFSMWLLGGQMFEQF